MITDKPVIKPEEAIQAVQQDVPLATYDEGVGFGKTLYWCAPGVLFRVIIEREHTSNEGHFEDIASAVRYYNEAKP